MERPLADEELENALRGLPHREPFVFVDRVLAVEAGTAARCEKVFGRGDPVFSGHFPGDPIVPGVLLTEALAQTAGIAASDGQGSFLLSAIRSMKFPNPARPGNRIELDARKVGEMSGLLLFECTALVGETIVAEGTVVLNRR